MTRSTTVFYSLSAQADNLGDIEIRRQVLTWLRESGQRVVLFVGPMPAAYLDGFGDLSDFEKHTASHTFELRLLGEALRGRATIVLAPGPQVFGTTTLAVRSLINVVNVMLAKSRKGRALAVGRSLRGRPSLGRSLDRLLIRQFDLYTVRDDASSDAIGIDLPKYPDLAFATSDTRPSEGARDLLALSFRSDREVPRDLLARLVGAARSVDLEPIFVSQVRRDDAQHERLSEALGVKADLWGDRSHLEQEEAVRGIYRRSAYVVSNRLHGLILGMQCGALPVGYSEAGYDKISSTLGSVVSGEAWPSAAMSDPLSTPWLMTNRDAPIATLEADLASASERLQQLKLVFLSQLLL